MRNVGSPHTTYSRTLGRAMNTRVPDSIRDFASQYPEVWQAFAQLDSYSEGMKNRLSMLGGHAEDSEQAAHASAKRFVVVVDR
jgi:hypothetical protein